MKVHDAANCSAPHHTNTNRAMFVDLNTGYTHPFYSRNAFSQLMDIFGTQVLALQQGNQAQWCQAAACSGESQRLPIHQQYATTCGSRKNEALSQVKQDH